MSINFLKKSKKQQGTDCKIRIARYIFRQNSGGMAGMADMASECHGMRPE